jgi:hypothetical protein
LEYLKKKSGNEKLMNSVWAYSDPWPSLVAKASQAGPSRCGVPSSGPHAWGGKGGTAGVGGSTCETRSDQRVKHPMVNGECAEQGGRAKDSPV